MRWWTARRRGRAISDRAGRALESESRRGRQSRSAVRCSSTVELGDERCCKEVLLGDGEIVVATLAGRQVCPVLLLRGIHCGARAWAPGPD
jgi:hypothetical protein